MLGLQIHCAPLGIASAVTEGTARELISLENGRRPLAISIKIIVQQTGTGGATRRGSLRTRKQIFIYQIKELKITAIEHYLFFFSMSCSHPLVLLSLRCSSVTLQLAGPGCTQKWTLEVTEAFKVKPRNFLLCVILQKGKEWEQGDVRPRYLPMSVIFGTSQ